MNKFSNTDSLSDYDAAILALESDPDNLDLKHIAVLSLARAGSLDFAQAAYEKYGLDKVRRHEDVMALGGRLSKDLYQVTSGKTALEHARDSAAKYEAAFKDSKGYYSGINSATMALMADMPLKTITDRVAVILDILPLPENLTAQDHYFIEASRAECFLLLGQTQKSIAALRAAIDFDPLNYVAHASTLKQFALILNKIGKDASWLATFKPPRPSHFAGHLWRRAPQSSADLPQLLSDVIQTNDIGFGYGALAAGADIVIAEALLSEGAELNVVLPSDTQTFFARSVAPYGEDWAARFETCLEQATSLTCLPYAKTHPPIAQDILSGQVAMGQAILRSQHLDVTPVQILICDTARGGSLTAMHKTDWKSAGLDGLEIPVDIAERPARTGLEAVPKIAILLARSDRKEFETYPSFDAAMAAISNDADSQKLMFGLDFDLPGAGDNLLSIMQLDLAGTVLITEAFAGFVALKYNQNYKVTFAGTVKSPSDGQVRTYTLQTLT